jgi:heavy metal translocating P-type ATPase
MAARAAADGGERLDLAPLLAGGRALLSVEGMWCPSCAAAVERVVGRVPGVRDARVDFATAAALVRWDPARLDPAALIASVERLGYRLGRRAAPDATAARIADEMRALAVRLAVAVALGMWVVLLAVALYVDGGLAASPPGQALALAAVALALPVVLGVGWPFHLAGWRTLRAGVPGMDTLVSIGAVAALGLSVARLLAGEAHVYADTAVMLVTLLLVGRLVELTATRRAVEAIGALAETLPERATRVGPGGELEPLPAAAVAVDDTILVAAGERLPLDGVCTAGTSLLDRSVLTGEAAPVEVRPGAEVEAGCVNLLSPLHVKVRGVVGARRMDAIGARIGDVLTARGAAQRLADRFARVLVPAALGLAVAALAAALAAGLAPDEALVRAVSVLVVACPCAVAVAVPLTYVAVARRAARDGVLFRGAGAVEALAGVDEVLFDKTGTLTEGRPRVHAVETAAGLAPNTVLRLAAAAEAGVAHPLAAALRDAVPDALPPGRAERLGRAVRWTGAEGVVLVGAADALRDAGIDVPPAAPTAATAVELARDGAWIGRIALADRCRSDAGAALERLAGLGLRARIVSGDAPAAVEAVAAELGVARDRVHGRCTPEDKAQLVAARPGRVAFVGDGINDGIALARAAAGIAVERAEGAATATAGIVLAGQGGLLAVADAIALARRGRRIMVQNLVFAVGYNAGGLALALGGAIPPAAAALAMVASSVSVTLNAWRVADSHASGASPDAPAVANPVGTGAAATREADA